MASVQHVIKEHAITAAQTLATRGKVHRLPDSARGLVAEANFTYGSGGTSTKVYIQTTFDGTNWIDIMCLAFTTASGRKVLGVKESTAIVEDVIPAVGALADDTAVSGIIGSKLRAQVVTTGTYADSTSLDLYVRIED